MPEGDTVFRAATALRKALQGARVKRFRATRLGPGPVGERIEDVSARGKNLIIRFEKGRALRTHMMMHGSWHIYREGERWQRPAFQARVELHADNDMVAVCFSAPVVEWLREETLAGLGPDATADRFDADEALRRLRTLDGSTLERALLAQSALSGVGNVIKCEALFLERRDPFRTVASVDDNALRSLIGRCHELLVRNRSGGPRATRAGTGRNRLWVYGRAQRPCLVCGEAVRTRTTLRLTYYCAHCQR
ncbi:MAG TPA: DNA-formamidopyrimidine glycosylase family protein [Myxococcales bacterium]|jgi:endonuclease-8|nr:DNA-formamidopyrimidine glycosylase family protein [Myxococcales bacterium]